MAEQFQTAGPHLIFAVICERVLLEADGVASLIRVVDRFNIQGPTETMPPTTLSLWIAILFKAGAYRGPARIGVQPVSPSGRELPALNMPVNFEGDDDRGVLVTLQAYFTVEETGLYWFDVSLSERPVTRIPLRVAYLPIQTKAYGEPPPGTQQS